MSKMLETKKGTIEYCIEGTGDRAGSGFLNDIKHSPGDLGRIFAPTLVIHSRHDGSNPFSHAQYLMNHIRGAELFVAEAESHLFWYSTSFRRLKRRCGAFCPS